MNATRPHAAAKPRSRLSRAVRSGGGEGGRFEAEARLRVALHQRVGEVCEIARGGPRFLWLCGSALLEAVPDTDGSVLLRAFLVLGPADDGRLHEQLDLYRGSVPLGQLVLDDDGDIALEYRVEPGAPRERLGDLIDEISRVADRLDDRLCARFGGIRSLDRLRRDILLALGD